MERGPPITTIASAVLLKKIQASLSRVTPWGKIPLKEIQLDVGPYSHQMWMNIIFKTLSVCKTNMSTLNTAILL